MVPAIVKFAPMGLEYLPSEFLRQLVFGSQDGKDFLLLADLHDPTKWVLHS